jgi:hypothetical protein
MKTAKNTKSILSIFGLQFIDNKLMHKNKNGEYIEVEFNGKPMLLNYDYERANNKEPFILFNPKELLKNGTYLAFEKYGLEALSIKFNEVVSSLLKYTSNLNLQNEETAQLHPLIINLNKLHDFRIDIESFEDLLEKWTKINDIVQKQSFMNIYINFNCKNELIKVEENTLSNQPIVTVNFPLYDLLINTKEEQIFGIDIKSTEIEALVTVYEFIFQNITKINGYQFPNKFTSIKEMDTKNSVPQLINTYVSAPFMFVKAFANIMVEINNIHDLLSSIEVFNLKNDPFNLIEIEDAIKELEKSKVNFDSHKDGKDGLGNLKTTPYIDIRRLNNELNKKCQNHSDSKSTSKEEKYVKIRSLNPRLSYKVNQTSGFLCSRPSTVMLNNSKVSSNYGIQILDPTDEESFNLIISPEAAIYHRHFLGASGIGKSEVLKVMAIKDIQDENSSFILLDGGQKLALELARQIDNPTRLVYIDESLDENCKISINPLDTKDKNPKNLAIMSKHISKSFELIMESEWSTNMEAVILPVIYILMEIGGFDIKDIKRFMDVANYEELCELALKSSNEDHKNFILNDFNRIKSITGTRDAIFMKLQSLISDGSINNCITGESTLNLEELVNTPGKIIIIKPESNAFGIFIMSMIQGIAEKRDVHNFIHTNLYVDEFSNYVSPSATKILSELRKKGLHLTMAHQELDQIKNIQNNIFANTHIKIVGKSSYEDLKTMAKELQINVKELESLGFAEFYIKVATNKAVKIKVTDKFIDEKAVMSKLEWQKCVKYQLENYYSKSKVATVNIKNEDILDSDDFESKLKNEFKLASKSTSKKLADF